MTEESAEKDEGALALDELYKDGRIPSLKGLLEVINKHSLKLVSVKSPSDKAADKPEDKS